jgi:phosphatidylserine decarboxylase
MRLWDVHINRVPLTGRVVKIEYKKGSCKLPTNKDAEFNERNTITLETKYGLVEITQIGGPFFKRIISFVKVGDEVSRASRIGMICFGSRVDVTIPPSFSICVVPHEKVKAGESIIAL